MHITNMGELLSVGSAYNIIDHITQLEVASQKQQRIPTFNIAIVISALASLTAVPTTTMNKCNNVMFVFLFSFSLMALGLFSLSVSAIMVNAQESSSSDNNRDGSGTDKQMGICVIGVKSPCNGDR